MVGGAFYDQITVPFALGFLYEFISGVFKGTLSADWKSYNAKIGEADKEIDQMEFLEVTDTDGSCFCQLPVTGIVLRLNNKGTIK